MAEATKTAGSRKAAKLSRLRKPEEMALEDWQIALRRQFATEQRFGVRNTGGQSVFSEYQVTNPATRKTYRVAIRGEGLGVNYCSCPDYAVNTLGTCKHVEHVLARLRRSRANAEALRRGFHPPYSEVYLRYGAKREVVLRPGSRCSGTLMALAGRFFGDDGLLRPEAYGRFHEFLERIGPFGQEVRCYDDALAFISRARDDAERIKRIDAAFPKGADDPAFDGLLMTRLYPYQREGALFAARAGRCLLADDMGLGKTVEAIAAAEILARTADLRRMLVICPTSLKHQWQREIERFAGRQAMVIEGLQPARARLFAADAFCKITNYDVIARDLEAIRRWRPDLVILDEAQRIKNWKTRTAQTVKQLESDYAFVLTGTPLENRLEELHSIVEFVDRFRLGPMFRFLAAHQHVDETGRVVGYRQLGQIAQTLAPILVRRTKDAVLKDLPERLEKRFFVPMTDPQRARHEENREIVARIVAKWRRYGYLTEIDQKRLTCALQNMRMVCDSTYLLDPATDHGLKVGELMTLLEEILEDVEAKVVVFSQWVRMHELIAAGLARRKWGHVFFHGGVPGPQRKDLVGRFREDPACRFFLSTDAGGVGLNLQHANVVANMDLPWNPAVLEQRIGRVHRLGQHKPVRVVHFIAQGAIEEGMLGLLSFKKSMFAGVLDGGEDEVFLGGTRLKQFMDTVDQATARIPPPAEATAEGAEHAEAREDEEARRLAASATAAAGLPDRPAAPWVPAGARGQTRLAAAPGAGAPGAAHAARLAAPAAATPGQLADLLAAGAAFLGQLGDVLRAGAPAAGQAPGAGLIARDDATGRSYLRLPLPEGGQLQQLLSALAPLLRR